MRAKSPKIPGPVDLRKALGRLEALPMRPASARQVLALVLDEDADPAIETTQLPQSTSTDPAWAVALSRAAGRPIDPLATLATHSWWPNPTASGPVAEALTRLWRHSMAVAFAARRLARDSGDPDPEAVARAGLLHSLGLWALASVHPEALVAWYDAADLATRRELERKWLGVEASGLGRTLAVRWECDPLVVDAAWLHGDLGADLNVCSGQPDRLALIQQAYASASTTPWAPGAELARESGPIDPRVRILTAEVQARSGGPFVDLDASDREERLTRDNARLRLENARMSVEKGSTDRFLEAFVGSSATEGPETWAERAGMAWCGELGVSAARVIWASREEPAIDRDAPHPPAEVIPLGDPARPVALIHLWGDPEARHPSNRSKLLSAWNAWAMQVSERDRVVRQLDDVIASCRRRVTLEEPTRRRQRLEALAEFAAGAGHELNNPLAVIVGRAQLLMVHEADPDSIRSLRAIIAQAQRAARILRDLMYVARPPEPRPRPCQPEEIVRACLRDLQGDAEARGVRIVAEARDLGIRVWADPEPLRQVADILTRNALEASSTGGLVQFTASGDSRAVRWIVHDHGRGIGATEGMHLFDPFYCGRAAGRGLGLGLPRAARIVAQLGGELRWQSSPGLGTTFLVTIPVAEIPSLIEEERPVGGKPDRALLTR